MFPFTAETVYTKDRLVRFSHTTSLARTWFWAYLFVCTVIIGVVCACLYRSSPSVLWFGIGVLMLDIFCILNHTVVPYFTLSKAKNLNARLCYTFHESALDLEVSNAYIQSSTTIEYVCIKKVVHRGQDLYLYLSSRHGFVVDTESLSAEQLSALKDALARHIVSKP